MPFFHTVLKDRRIWWGEFAISAVLLVASLAMLAGVLYAL